jgi:hypothetical protein
VTPKSDGDSHFREENLQVQKLQAQPRLSEALCFAAALGGRAGDLPGGLPLTAAACNGECADALGTHHSVPDTPSDP